MSGGDSTAATGNSTASTAGTSPESTSIFDSVSSFLWNSSSSSNSTLSVENGGVNENMMPSAASKAMVDTGASPSSGDGNRGGFVSNLSSVLSTVVVSTLLQPPGSGTVQQQQNHRVLLQQRLDRVIGTALTLGIGLTLFRISTSLWFTLEAQRRRRRRDRRRRTARQVAADNTNVHLLAKEDGEEENEDLEEDFQSTIPSWIPFVLRFVLIRGFTGRRVARYDSQDASNISKSHKTRQLPKTPQSPDSYHCAVRESTTHSPESTTDSRSPEPPLLLPPCRGSCHCEAIEFEVYKLGTTIRAYDCPGKVRYPRIRLKTSSQFHILAGMEFLKVHYSRTTNNKSGNDGAGQRAQDVADELDQAEGHIAKSTEELPSPVLSFGAARAGYEPDGFVHDDNFLTPNHKRRSGLSSRRRRHQSFPGVSPASSADSPNTTVSAHAFCVKCGVHILHAPNNNADALEVNAHCLDVASPITSGTSEENDNPDGSPRVVQRKIEVVWEPEPNSTPHTSAAPTDAGDFNEENDNEDARPSKSWPDGELEDAQAPFAMFKDGLKNNLATNEATPLTTTTAGESASRSSIDGGSSFGSEYSFTPRTTTGTQLFPSSSFSHSPQQYHHNPHQPVYAVDDSMFPLQEGAAGQHVSCDSSIYSSPEPRTSWTLGQGGIARVRHSRASSSSGSGYYGYGRRSNQNSGSPAARRLDPSLRDQLTYYMKRHISTSTSMSQTVTEEEVPGGFS